MSSAIESLISLGTDKVVTGVEIRIPKGIKCVFNKQTGKYQVIPYNKDSKPVRINTSNLFRNATLVVIKINSDHEQRYRELKKLLKEYKHSLNTLGQMVIKSSHQIHRITTNSTKNKPTYSYDFDIISITQHPLEQWVSQQNNNKDNASSN
jgi:hypothetical protein